MKAKHSCPSIIIAFIILVPSAVNAAENRAGIAAIGYNSASLQQRSAQRKAELDQAARLDKQGLQYEEQGRYDEAEPLYRRALAIRERVLGPNHRDTAESL